MKINRLTGARIALTALLGIQASCSAQTQDGSIDLTSYSAEELIFPAGGIYERFRPIPGSAAFCISEPVATDARISFVSDISGAPGVLRFAGQQNCDLNISIASGTFDADYAFSGCEWKFAREGNSEIVALNITSNRRELVENCFTRLAMILAGYPGAMTFRDEDLFISKSKSIWAPQDAMPELIPRLPHIFFICGYERSKIRVPSDIPTQIKCK